MAIRSKLGLLARQGLQTRYVYLMAAVCLAAGLMGGYLARGWRMPAPVAQVNTTISPHAGAMTRPSLEQMRQMADKQAGPLLEKLKADPNNADLLVQVGGIYHSTHQFRQASVYYERAVKANSADVAIRTKLAASLYRMGDVDGAIAQLKLGLVYDPTNANSLFDLGMIEWQGKEDRKGALAAWERLLKTNAHLSADRKAVVEKMIAEVKSSAGGAATK